MDKENRNSAGRGKSYNQQHADTDFCPDLLNCCACDKIYFSKQPIALSAFSKKSYHVCLHCSRSLRCTICRKAVSPAHVLVVEDLPNATRGILCPRCRSKFLGRDRSLPRNSLQRMYAAIASGLNALAMKVRRLLSLELFPRG